MNRIIGAESCSAICSPCAALVAPGPRVTKQNSGPSGEPPLGQRHDRRAGFLPADGQFDRRVVHGVEGGEVRFARNAINPFHPLCDELVDENLSARSQSPAQRRLLLIDRGMCGSLRPSFQSSTMRSGVVLRGGPVPAILGPMSAPTERPPEFERADDAERPIA